MSNPQLPVRRPDDLPTLDSTRSSSLVDRGLVRLRELNDQSTTSPSSVRLGANTVSHLWSFGPPGDAYPSVIDVVGGLVYVASSSDDQGVSWLSAIDVSTGAVIWSFPLRASFSSGVEGNVVWAAGRSSKGGTAYGIDSQSGVPRWIRVGTYAGYSDHAKSLVYLQTDEAISAVDVAEGSLRWSHAVGAGAHLSLVGGMAFIYDDQGLRALDAMSGRLRWQFNPGGRVHFSRTTEDKVLAVDYDRHYLYCIDSTTGTERWRSHLGARGLFRDVINSTVYVSVAEWLFALGIADLKERWRFRAPDILATPKSWSNGTILVSTYRPGEPNGQVLSVVDEAIGEELWSVTSGSCDARSWTVDDELGIICVISNGWVVGIDGSSGAERWRIELREPSGIDEWHFASYDMPGYVTDYNSVCSLDLKTGREEWFWQVDSEYLPPGGDEQEPPDSSFWSDPQIDITESEGVVLVVLGHYLHALQPSKEMSNE